MKNFSFRIFIFSSFFIGFFTFISMMAGWDLHYDDPGISLFWKILGKSFFVFNWALTLIYWITKMEPPNPSFLLGGIVFNCLLDGLIIERLFSLRKKKS